MLNISQFQKEHKEAGTTKEAQGEQVVKGIYGAWEVFTLMSSSPHMGTVLSPATETGTITVKPDILFHAICKLLLHYWYIDCQFA